MASMLRRCYTKDKQTKSYENCYVCDEWHNYSNFEIWYENNYYRINEDLDIDKDILIKNNNIYSPNTCLLVPKYINGLFIRIKNTPGECLMGVYYDKERNLFVTKCREKNKRVFLGRFSNEVDAFQAYKEHKESYIKKVALEYKDIIPQKVFDAMMRYEVEIND